MTAELHKSALVHIESKFNLLLKLDAREFDCDWAVLLQSLQKIKIENFSQDDRILICHMDTDYYDPLVPTGTIVNNLIRCFQFVDIPMYLLLFVTNHYGISREFDLLLQDEHPNNRPTVVETLLSPMLLSESPYKPDSALDIERIEKSGLCMVGAQRSHRVALLNFFKNNNLLDKIAIGPGFAKK
jgi:hypothetical protein